MDDADIRYQAKLAARKNGTTPVFTAPPAPATGGSQDAIDARYKAKLEARKAEPKPEAKAEKPPAEAKAEAEPKPEAKAEKRRQG